MLIGITKEFIMTVNNKSSSSSMNSYADYSTPVEEIPFEHVVKPGYLICRISKKFMTVDPVILGPCGHLFSRAALSGWTICPISTCGKYIIDKQDAPDLKDVAVSYVKILMKPDSQVKNKLNELYEAFPDTENKKAIKEALDLFFQSGDGLKQGMKMVTEAMIGKNDPKPYLAIFQVMNEHYINASNKVDKLAQEADLPAVSKNPPQAAPQPATGIKNGALNPQVPSVEGPVGMMRPMGCNMGVPMPGPLGGSMGGNMGGNMGGMPGSMGVFMGRPMPGPLGGSMGGNMGGMPGSMIGITMGGPKPVPLGGNMGGNMGGMPGSMGITMGGPMPGPLGGNMGGNMGGMPGSMGVFMGGPMPGHLSGNMGGNMGNGGGIPSQKPHSHKSTNATPTQHAFVSHTIPSAPTLTTTSTKINEAPISSAPTVGNGEKPENSSEKSQSSKLILIDVDEETSAGDTV
jgi:hypothetical protein